MSSNTPKTRFLILNRVNVAILPRDNEYSTDDVAAAHSPSFTSKEKAMEFGTFLADENPGERFYLARIESVACTPTSTIWLDTVPASCDDECSGDDDDVSDDDDE